jgi:hypothetical protein
MKWNLPELTEDAFKSYLEANLNLDMNVYVAWGNDEDSIEYPCVIIHADATEPVSEPAEWHDPRMMNVQLAVMTEAVALTDDDGNEILSVRDRNIEARSEVINLLAISGLNAALIARGIEDIAFSMAQMTTTERSTEDHKLITTITVEVIAEPVTGS